MKAARPRSYDKAHKTLFDKRETSYKQGWDRSLDLAREVSRYVVGASVLDLGCGMGFFAKYVKGAYLGVDFSPYSVEKAKAMNWSPTANFMVNDLYALPGIGQFDTVVMLEVLEHLVDRPTAVRVAKGLTKKRLVVSVPRGRSRSEDHIWNDITKEDVLKLLGPSSTCYQYRRKWIGVWGP